MTIWLPEMKAEGPRYLAIADAIAADTSSGRLSEGDRLPTHRELADALGVSIGTVTRAYATAERRGLVRGETGRGTFVAGVVDGRFEAVPGVGDSGAGSDLDVSWPLYALDPSLGSALRTIAASPRHQELLRYQPNAGIARHRMAGAQWAQRFGVEASADDVVVCSGTQHALTVILASLTEPGDTVFAESLTYPGFNSLARLLNLRVVGIPMDRHGLVPDEFESACRSRRGRVLYTIPTLHNPTATTLSRARRREIARIAKSNGVAVIEDPVHHLLADDPPPPLACYAPENTFFIAGMSKVVTGGLRTAFLVTPRRWLEAMVQGVWATAWMSAPLCAEITAMWINDGTADATIERKRKESAARVEMARARLPERSLTVARCGYHAWLRLPERWDSASFANEARRRGAAVTASNWFLAGGEEAPRAVRLSLSAPRTRDAVAAGLDVVAGLLAESPGTGPPII